MVNVNDLSPPSNTLKAADIGGDEWELTISSYVIKEFDQTDQKGASYKQPKPVFSFHEVEKTLVCNKTNRDEIRSVYGDEIDDWVGKKIILFTKKVEFQGKLVDSIRVRVERPRRAPSGPKSRPSENPADGMDEAPF